VGGPDRVIDVEVGDLVGPTQQRGHLGQVHQQPGGDGVQLADVAELIPAQVGAQRGRGPAPSEDLGHPAVPGQVHVFDAVRAGHHPGDQGGHLQVSVGAGRAWHGHMVGDQVREPGFLGQGHHRDQTRGGDQVRVIEIGREVVADSHYRVLLFPGRCELS